LTSPRHEKLSLEFRQLQEEQPDCIVQLAADSKREDQGMMIKRFATWATLLNQENIRLFLVIHVSEPALVEWQKSHQLLYCVTAKKYEEKLIFK
jgi:hypothetical protein